MRAAVVRKIGGPEAVEILEVPLPEPGPLEVRIKVAAAALNPADAGVWSGVFKPLDGAEYSGLGLDAAGTIDAVGAAVSMEIGTPVIAFDSAVLRPTKAQAEILEVPLPEPGPLEVRIKVAAAALNPADAGVWSGVFKPLDGAEYSGLDAVGAAVSMEIGTPVIAFDSAVLRPTKAQAEYLVVDLNSIAVAPEGMDLTLAATIPMNAMTASLALDNFPLRPRSTLLVTGAAGAVGGYAVELARTRGVRIVAQGRPEDEEFLRDRGATWFVSRDEDLSEAVRRFVPDGVDGVLDAAAVGSPALASVRDGGTFVSVRGDVLPTPERRVVVLLTLAGVEGTRLAYLAALAEVGLLTPQVGQIYPLSQAAEAHAHPARGGRRGRIVLVP